MWWLHQQRMTPGRGEHALQEHPHDGHIINHNTLPPVCLTYLLPGPFPVPVPVPAPPPPAPPALTQCPKDFNALWISDTSGGFLVPWTPYLAQKPTSFIQHSSTDCGTFQQVRDCSPLQGDGGLSKPRLCTITRDAALCRERYKCA